MITVYTQPGCGPCKRVVTQLRDAGLVEGEDFDVADITVSPDDKDFVVNRLKARATPVITSWTHPPIFANELEKLGPLINLYKATKES
jgi:glutaredoxin-like protein NrdH